MRSSGEFSVPTAPGFFDRLLGRFTDVHPGEGARATVMLLNIFVIMVSSYFMKTLREPLILANPVPPWRVLQALGVRNTAELSSYAAAGSAMLMMIFVPAYSWFASRVDHMKLVFGVTLFYVANIVLFALGVQAGVEGVGVIFYIWLGLFNMSIVAQFWSYANDIYTEDAGHRLFPIIVVGMTAGAPVGPWIVGLASGHVSIPALLYVAAALLLGTVVLYELVNRGATAHHAHHAAVADKPIGGKDSFSLVFGSRYILLIAVLFVLLNCVNSMGEFIRRALVSEYAQAAARADVTFNAKVYIQSFSASYFFWVNVAAIVLQIFVAPRLVKRFGMGVLFVLPLVALGAYAFIAFGATLFIVRWAKTAENSTDYSIMNTARQLLWLPTSREEKYKAKQATDTFFVRLGDVLQAVVVFIGVRLAFGMRSFAALNLAFVIAWVALAVMIWRLNRKLSAAKPAETAAV